MSGINITLALAQEDDFVAMREARITLRCRDLLCRRSSQHAGRSCACRVEWQAYLKVLMGVCCWRRAH